MIKRWSKFNESNSVDNFKSEVEKIRSYFVEFEDDNLVTYEAKVIGRFDSELRRVDYSPQLFLCCKQAH
jgi:Zn-dependent M32 family carboxypeptidase